MVTITLDVGGGNSTVITVPVDDALIRTRSRGEVRADEIQVGDLIPDYDGSCYAATVATVEVS